jgi:hypothetical protein
MVVVDVVFVSAMRGRNDGSRSDERENEYYQYERDDAAALVLYC